MSISIKISVSLTFSLFLSSVFVPIFIFSVVAVVLIQCGSKAAKDSYSLLLSIPKHPYLLTAQLPHLPASCQKAPSPELNVLVPLLKGPFQLSRTPSPCITSACLRWDNISDVGCMLTMNRRHEAREEGLNADEVAEAAKMRGIRCRAEPNAANRSRRDT